MNSKKKENETEIKEEKGKKSRENKQTIRANRASSKATKLFS